MEEKIKNKIYYTYMLRCQDNSIYTGITTDLNRRMQEHFGKTDKCAKYTFNHTPQKLECAWESKSRVLASKLEYHIKKLSKAQKEELIANNNLKKFLSEKITVDSYKKCSLNTGYF